MSTPIAQYKLPSRIEIGFDSEAKASIADLKNKSDEITKTLNIKGSGNVNSLQKTLQATTTNDAPIISAPSKADIRRGCEFDLATSVNANIAIPADIVASNMFEFKQLGQWVFEGQDEKWQFAAIDADGRVVIFSSEPTLALADGGRWLVHSEIGAGKRTGDNYDASGWESSLIKREFNSSGLGGSMPYIAKTLDHTNCISKSIPKTALADMQLIFIKNLSEFFIQRMHSMERFSTHDYTISGHGGDLMTWDIFFDPGAHRFGLVIAQQEEHIACVFFQPSSNKAVITTSQDIHKKSYAARHMRNINENELPAFRAALEACYA